METDLVLSLSSMIGLLGLFWTWHKEQKQTTSEISVLKNKVETNLAFYISLILLISPWFRSTSYWGTTENFALFFVVPSLFFFEKVINQRENYIQNNILLIIFLSCSIYARQQYFFLVIAHVLIIFYNKYDFKSTILFFFPLI